MFIKSHVLCLQSKRAMMMMKDICKDRATTDREGKACIHQKREGGKDLKSKQEEKRSSIIDGMENVWLTEAFRNQLNT